MSYQSIFVAPDHAIRVGQYRIWQIDKETLAILHDNGEAMRTHVNDFSDTVDGYFAEFF